MKTLTKIKIAHYGVALGMAWYVTSILDYQINTVQFWILALTFTAFGVVNYMEGRLS